MVPSKEQRQSADSQEEETRISLNLFYIVGMNEKLQRKLRTQKIRSTFYIENTLCKLLCKPKYPMVKEDKNSIVYEIN